MTAIADEKQFAVILNNVPNSIERVLDCAPISALVNAGAKKSNIEAVLAIEIARISKLLTVGGNLREGQSIEIAMQLIQDYPNESLEDFCLCLRRGVKGAYGDIFRFDILVIYDWFKKYLEEKYIVAEKKLHEEKDDLYKLNNLSHLAPKGNDKAWQDGLDKLKEAVGMMESKKPAPLTNKDVLKEGQEKPAYKKSYIPEDPQVQAMREAIKDVAREAYGHLRTVSDMSNFQRFKIEGYEIFAASKEDAELIYNEAKSRRQ